MTRPTIAFICALLLCPAAGPALAQTGPYGATAGVALEALTLRDAEMLFAERNREVQLARRATEGAEAEILTARARPNPTLSIGTTNISPSAGIGAGSLRDKRIDTTVGLSQLIERGGKRELRTQAAEYTAAAVHGDELDTLRQQRAALYSAYYDLVLAQERIRVTEETAAAFGKTVEAADRRLKAGDIAPTEVARINVDALRAQNDARTARAEREKAQLALAYLIGADREARRINAVEGWPDLHASFDVDLERVLTGRADVQAAQARLNASERSRDLARSLRTRDVVAGIQYERFPGDVSNNSYGFNVSVPLFTSYYYQGEIRRSEVEYQAAQEQLERVRAQALAEIGKATSDLTAATERIRRFREVLLAAAEKAANGAEFAYTRGAIGVMDLLDARRQFYATRLEAIAAQADYAKALTAWRAATAPAATAAR
jgi:outer membrane protein, heavy metal efflux system